MTSKSVLLLSIFTLAGCSVAIAQQPTPTREVYVAPNAPKDKPVNAQESEAEQIEAAIKPYIEKAKSTYPEAKARFLKGLPPKHTFFITTRLTDASKRIEQVFIAVHDIKDGKVSGAIASEIHLVSGYKFGDTYTFPESELIDWTISKPDGTEEGNFVGNFLDSYQVTHVIGDTVWRNEPVTPVRMNQRLEAAAVHYADHGPIPRIVLYDVGFPLDAKEYAALDGNAVILFTAVSQTREELPLQRVYVLSDGKEVELKLVRVVLAELKTADTQTAKTFGRFRADALYLLPMSLRVQNVDLLVDFQSNRSGFKVATFGTPLPEDVSRLMSTKPSGAGPSQSALETFIKREYPTLVEN